MNKTPDDLKKGTRVLLTYGEQGGNIVSCDDFKKWLRLGLGASSYKAWEADLMDDKKGTIRLMKVYGWETDLGDTYSHKILAYLGGDGFWHPVDLTDEQKEMKKLEENLLN